MESLLWVILISSVSLCLGQLPKECTYDKGEDFDGICCPVVSSYGVCGGVQRGHCINITDSYPQYDCDGQYRSSKYCTAEKHLKHRPIRNQVDIRYRWPSQIFTKVCECFANYGGYNCMRCKPGYSGEDCSQKQSLYMRKNFLHLSDGEKQEFLDIIDEAKSSKDSRITIPRLEPITSNGHDSFLELSIYDIFAIYHYYTNRDKMINRCAEGTRAQEACNGKCPVPDFAHWGPAFLTWHRGYLLYLEEEIRDMLKRSPRTRKYFNYQNFALHYWDWTDETVDEDDIWVAIGDSNALHNSHQITEGRFSSWSVVCKDHNELLCDSDSLCFLPTPGHPIERNVGGGSGKQCLSKPSKNAEYSTLPNAKDFQVALQKVYYDVPGYGNHYTTGGFRNALEGFKSLGNSRKSVCENLNVKDRPPFPFFELHNRVHVYIGGTMSDIVISSNDPIFYLHHSNVDRLYESWYRTHVGSYLPDSFSYDVLPGHNIDEPLVALFPRVTNGDMHKRTTDLGYDYDEVVTVDAKLQHLLTTSKTTGQTTDQITGQTTGQTTGGSRSGVYSYTLFEMGSVLLLITMFVHYVY